MSTQKWLSGRVVKMERWTPTLFSVIFEAPGFSPFVAGQFARVGLTVGDEIVGRPYSLVNPPQCEELEIFAIEVANGPLSPKLNQLREGNEIFVMPRANGFFSISETPPADTLWCLATGTGLGPFLSMLRTDAPWAQFKNVVLVHGVRHQTELTYQRVISELALTHGAKFRYLPLVSRDGVIPANGRISLGRITTLFDTGALERAAGWPLDITAHVMLCGNPQMVADMIVRMEARGMRKHRRREPGHYTTEAYW